MGKQDRVFTNPDFGSEVRIEQYENHEVHLIFVAGSEEKASNLIDRLLEQLKTGALNLTLMGRLRSVTDTGAT